MGKLLRKLGLEDKIPDELNEPNKRIAGKEAALGSKLTKELKLKDTAGNIAENMRDLEAQVEPGLFKAKTEQFQSLSRRIDSRQPDDPGLKTDAYELQMLHAETEVVLKNNDKNRKALDKARTAFGAALVDRLDSGGDLAQDLKTYIDGHVANGSTNRLNAALAGLDGLKKHPDPRIAGAAKQVTKQLAQEALTAAKSAGPSMAPRDASRTPNDVLVHVSTLVNNGLEAHKDDKELKRIATAGRKLFMSHTLDGTKVKALVNDAKVAFGKLGENDIAALCETLDGQITKPKADEDAPDEAVEPTNAQLNDNLYGRVFDTKMVSALVKSPPQELLDASGKSGAAFANMLADTPDNEEAAMYFIKEYVKKDRRPWSAAVPGFAELEKATDGKSALAALKQFLKAPPTTGQDIIAFSYTMAKMPQAQKSTDHEPVWLTNASVNYTNITNQANRERGAATGEKIVSTGAGITMLHQPDASDDPTLIPSERPGTANRMGIRKPLQEGQESDDPMHDISQTKLSTQNKLQLNQALPFASGVSGTTNILLHLYEEMEKNGPTGTSPNEFLMNSMMFLVYDGGHSMHEAMYTANQIEKDLKSITFGLSDPNGPKDPRQFVSDYDRLMEKFPDKLKKAMEEAQDEAWQGTQEYLEKNSFFAQ